MRRGFVVGSEYKLETFWLRSQLKRNIVSIKWQNNWTEKKNNPELLTITCRDRIRKDFQRSDGVAMI